MQKIIAALALTGASAFVAPSVQRAALKVHAEEDAAEAAPAPAPAAAPTKKGARKDNVDPSKSQGGLNLAGLQALAYEQNPIVGYFDPLELSLKEFFDESNTATIGFLRQAEIKHGRVAMAAFLGCAVNGLGLEFPGAVDLAGDSFKAAGSTKLPLETWDAIPAAGRLQLIMAVGGIEFVFESQKPHYLRGGKPGFVRLTPGVAPWHASGYDPMGKYSAEDRQKKRNMEIANGRLAMLGMAAFVAAEKIPGSVPILANLGFAGDYAGTMPGNPLPSAFVM